MQRIIIMGPAHPLRGGLATFNQRLAQEFIRTGNECVIVSYSLQYPSILFPGQTQYTNEPAPKGITIYSLINSINPINWFWVGRKLWKMKPDIVIVRYWIPFMGPALGTILRQVKKNRHTKVICLADNVIPHEKRIGDKIFTNYFLKACDGFITMSQTVMNDLRSFEKEKPAKYVLHPVYDTFGEIMSKGEARKWLGLKEEDKIILFFGLIRRYKGLDTLIEAMADERIRKEKIKLLVAGEFYEDEKPYLQLIDKHNLSDAIILKNKFIPDSEVKYYICAADCVVQPYRSATQSGVTPLAYYFEKPIIVTNIGGLPDLVLHLKTGLVSEPSSEALTESILNFYQLGEQHFIPNLYAEKQKYSWSTFVNAVTFLADEVSYR